jgi:hypothetical protein
VKRFVLKMLPIREVTPRGPRVIESRGYAMWFLFERSRDNDGILSPKISWLFLAVTSLERRMLGVLEQNLARIRTSVGRVF